MKIVIFPLGPLETNCYLLHNESEAVIIDVGGDPASVVGYLKRNGLTLTDILCTHLHFDHVYGVQALVRATGAKVHGSERDRFLLSEEGWGAPKVEAYASSDLKPGELSLLGTTCTVLETPGHTPGGLSFYFPDLSSVFVGDSLFYRSIGRTDFSGGSFDDLARSIRTQLFSLPDGPTLHSSGGDLLNCSRFTF